MQFRLMSPGTGAYRVQLSQVSGEEAVEAVLAGEGDEMRVDLPPGEYWGRVVELGQSTASGHRFRLQLRSNEPQVRLPSKETEAVVLPSRSGALDPAIRSTRLPRISQTAETKPHESRRPARGGLIVAPRLPTIASTRLSERILGALQRPRSGDGALRMLHTSLGFDGEVRKTFSQVGLRGPAERVPFAIGISEDRSPEKQGSWTRPSSVQIDSHTIADGICVHFNQHRDGTPEGGYRVRMTLAIAGVPAIRVPIPIYAKGSFVEIRPVRIGDQVDFAVEIKAFSERVQALVAAVTELTGEEALKILRWNAESQIGDAIEILAEKRRDLWAATAAALLLVKARRLEGVEQWLLNLSNFAPHIPDAAVAAAWARAAQGTGGRRHTEQSVMEILKRGLSVGALTFSIGNSLALELLNVLLNSAQDREIRSAALDAYMRVARRSRYKIYRGPYMLWEQTGNRLQTGRLPGPRYLEIVRGEV